jgi:hypothetical protein
MGARWKKALSARLCTMHTPRPVRVSHTFAFVVAAAAIAPLLSGIDATPPGTPTDFLRGPDETLSTALQIAARQLSMLAADAYRAAPALFAFVMCACAVLMAWTRHRAAQSCNVKL